MFEIKLTIEAGPVLAAALTALTGNVVAAPVQKVAPAKGEKVKDAPVTKIEPVAATEEGGGKTLKDIRDLLQVIAVDEKKRPAIKAVFEKFGVKGASDTPVEHYDELYTLLSAI